MTQKHKKSASSGKNFQKPKKKSLVKSKGNTTHKDLNSVGNTNIDDSKTKSPAELQTNVKLSPEIAKKILSERVAKLHSELKTGKDKVLSAINNQMESESDLNIKLDGTNNAWGKIKRYLLKLKYVVGWGVYKWLCGIGRLCGK